MAQTVSARADTDHREALEDYADDGNADSPSEALRQTSQAELARQGYLNGNGNTTLKWASKEFSRAFAWIGVAWLAFTFTAPVEYRLGAVFALSAALACSALYVLLDTHEPHISERLGKILGRDKA